MAASDRVFRVLTIDGGGIDGVIPAAVLAHIEAQAAAAVAELFDLVVGTSTGGILALGLTAPGPGGRPKFSASDLDRLYREDAGEIFKPWRSPGLVDRVEDAVAEGLVELNVVGHNEWEALSHEQGKPVPWWRALFHPKYSGEGIETFLQKQLGVTRLSGPVAGVHAAVTTFDIDTYKLRVLRSWEAARDPSSDFPMWAAARSTSAAPTFFPPAAVSSLDGKSTLHGIDGGVAVNDPVLVGYAEARRIQKRLAGDAASFPILVVSIGTGAPPDQSIRYAAVKGAGVLGWSLHGLMDVLLEGANLAANEIAEELLPEESFFRFQAALSGPGFHVSPAIDDWSTDNIEALQKAAAYLIERDEATLTYVIDRLKRSQDTMS